MTAEQDQQPISALQRRFHQLQMAPMKGLKPSDQDGNALGHGNLRIPEMNTHLTGGHSLGTAAAAGVSRQGV